MNLTPLGGALWSSTQVRWPAGDLLNVTGCGFEKLVSQVGQCASHSELVPDLWHVMICRVEPGKPVPDQPCLIPAMKARQRPSLAVVLINMDLNVPALTGDHVMLLIG
jgi:hypothetical protein